jgi:hypothetical protein
MTLGSDAIAAAFYAPIMESRRIPVEVAVVTRLATNGQFSGVASNRADFASV